MQNNLATDVIKELKYKIKILVSVLVLLSVFLVGIFFAYIKKVHSCDCQTRKTAKNQIVETITRKETLDG